MIFSDDADTVFEPGEEPTANKLRAKAGPNGWVYSTLAAAMEMDDPGAD